MTSCSQDIIAEGKIIKCSICLGRSRKIEELEGMVSCKNDILKAQQNRLKNVECNYKQLFDDFERLRLNYSFALQANCSLKEINLKLEQFTARRKRCTTDEKKEGLCTISDCGRILDSPPNKEQPICQEFNKIQTIFRTQNYTLKINKSNNSVVKEPNEKQEFVQNLDSSPNLKSVGIETQPTYIQEVQSEEKIINITFPEPAVNELLQSTETAKVDEDIMAASTSKTIIHKDKHTLTMNIDDPNLPMVVVELKIHMQEQSKQFEKCACQLVEQLDDMHDSNQVLADTLSVVTQENKNNLQIITDLKIELRKANEECETKTNELKKLIIQLENELEDHKIAQKTLRNSIEITENEVQKLQGDLKHVVEENCMLKDCKCEYEQEFRANLAQGADEVNRLRKELEEKNEELAEYEEENKHFSQKIELLNTQNTELNSKVRQLEQELLLKDVKNQSHKTSQTSLIQINMDDLEIKMKRLEKENEYLTEKCKEHELEKNIKSSEVDGLKSELMTQLNELDKLSIENDELKKEMEQLKRDNQLETEKLQEVVGKSQIQVEKLLREHDEKSNEIEQVANELTHIRRSVTEDNDKYLGIIKQLEREREDLEIKLKQRSSIADCICGESKAEFERLKTELLKKQVIIFELERTMNELNANFKHFDRTAEDLAYENQMLKSDRDNYIRDLEALQAALSEKINELEEMRKKLENSDILCDKCMKAAKDTGGDGKDYSDNLELEMELMRYDMEKLQQEKRQMELTVADYYQLQMEIESLRGENQKRDSFTSRKLSDLQKAYDELKHLFDVKNTENDKLRNDLIKSETQKSDSEKKCECMEERTKMLEEQTDLAVEEACAMKAECDQLRQQCARKCVDIEVLKEDVKTEMEQRRLCYENCEGLKKKHAASEVELLEMRDKLDELGKKYEDKSQELKKIKKQYDSCAKQSKISREEYSNLRKEYKEIKSMLSDQLRKYKTEAEKVDGKNKKPCDVVQDLRNQLMDKDRQIEQLQQKLKDCSYEIIELKDYVHKLISDNNALKTGINSLIENLERKIKGGPSLGSLPSNSAEAIAGEILNSLSNIEDIISKNPHVCPKGCGFKNCDCMNQILSQYSFKTEPQQGPSRGFSENRFYVSPSTKSKTESLSKFSSVPSGPSMPESTSQSMPEPTRVISETNTTDSDDVNADRQSLQFFKDAVVDLRTRIDKTMKEKSCDCEEVFAENPKKQR